MEDIKVFTRFCNELASVRQFVNENNVRRTKLNYVVLRKKRHIRRFNPLTDLNENQFRIKYRYSKENLRRIIEIVRDDDFDADFDYNEPVNSNQVPIELQILSAIRFWGGTEHPKLTAQAHGVSLRTLIKISRKIASVLSTKASRYIRMPATLSEKELVMRSFQDLANMPQIIGALVQTSVRVQSQPESRGNSGVSSPYNVDLVTPTEELVHLQVVCDASHKIRDLDMRLYDELGHKTIAADMFSLSRIKERFEQNEFRGRILLGNESLSSSSYLLTPVQCPKNQSEELYNRAHATTFASSAISCINVWFKRFGILGTELLGTFGSVKQSITALALLHNMAMEWNDPSLDADYNVLLHKTIYNIPCSMNEYKMIAAAENQQTRKQFIKSHFK